MIASLMMYRRPEIEESITRFWQAIRTSLAARGIDSPETLSQDKDEVAVWTDPALLLSQTCGLPFRTFLKDKVKLVGTPDYALDGCPPGHYRSAFVVRADDARDSLDAFRAARFAFSQTTSQSGLGAPFNHLAPRGWWFADRTETGAHRSSAIAVAEGRADIAAIDAQTWRLIVAHDEFAARLRVLDWTEPTPGLPLITAPGRDPAVLFAAVAEAIAALPNADRAALYLTGLCAIPAEAYFAVPNPDAAT